MEKEIKTSIIEAYKTHEGDTGSVEVQVALLTERIKAGKSTKIEWFKPVYANDVLTAKATVTSLTQRNGKNGIAEVTIEAYNQKGELVLTNVTEAVVKIKL